MKFTTNLKEFLSAIEKCVTVNGTYKLGFTSHRDEAGSIYSSIIAGDSNSMSCIYFMSQTEESKPNVSVIVGEELHSAVRALAPIGNELIIELYNNKIELRCASALIPLVIKEDSVKFKPKSPKNDAHCQFKINSQELKKAIKLGGFAVRDPKESESALSTIFMLPVLLDESEGMRIISADGCYVSSAFTSIEGDDSFKEMAKSKKGICLPPKTIEDIVFVLENKIVDVFIFDTQIMIKDGNDIFCFVYKDYSYPHQISSIIDDPGYKYKFSVKVSDLRIASKIATVNSSDDYEKCVMVLNLNEKDSFVTSEQNLNKSPLNATNIEGSIRIGLSCKRLDKILNTGITSDTVIIYGNSSLEPIHIMGENIAAGNTVLLPIKLNSETKKSKDKDEVTGKENDGQ